MSLGRTTSLLARRLLSVSRGLPSVSSHQGISQLSILTPASSVVSLRGTQFTNDRPVFCVKFLQTQCRLYNVTTTNGDSSEETLQWYDVDTEELVKRVKGEEGGVQLFDIRETDELRETGIIPTATHMPLGDVKNAFKLDANAFKEKYGVSKPSEQDENIYFYCKRGIRSLTAIDTAHKLGYSKARHYLRGIDGWKEPVNKFNG